jgi:uncharacterized protein YjbI with pentapeptide repeats/uncharacterized RDD family membrane protein YckC
MVIPIQRKDTHRSETPGQKRSSLPILVRRCGAWAVEVSLIVASGAVPFSIGLYAQSYSENRTPLNPVLVKTTDAIAQTLALPIYQKNPQVTPATNVFWTVALVAPLALGSWQLYRLGKTGQTLPKAWFGIKVVTQTGAPPGLGRVLVREGIARWGLPVGVAFLVWRYGGAYPHLGLMGVLTGLTLVGEGAIALVDPKRRTLHDKLAKTLVVEATQTPAIGFPPAPPRWLIQPEAGTPRHQENPHSPPPTTYYPLPTTHSNRWQRFWDFWEQNSVPAWLTVSFASLVGLWGSYVGLQIYTQTQANRRAFEERNNEVFIALAKQLSATATASSAERQAAILAFGAVKDDPRALRLLADLLNQEKNLSAIAAIEQVFVSIGSSALPELQRLNQLLTQELTSRRYDVNPQEYQWVQQRLLVTQEAIANILTLDSSQKNIADLSRTNLSQESNPKIKNLRAQRREALSKIQNDLSSTNLSQESNTSVPFTLMLDNQDISGINFQGANLTGASFQGSRFRSAGNDQFLGTFDDWVADLSGAVLNEANLTGAILTNVSLEKTNLIHATLNQADLSQARLANANLSSAKLIGANLRQAILEKASLTGADLTEADFSRANLHAASLGRVSAVGTQLPGANLTASDWRGANLSGANLSHANLQNANFSDTQLAGTNFSKAQLQNVNFSNADLSMADLQGANLAEADFRGAIFVAPKPVPPDQFIQPQPNISLSTRVNGVDFSQVKNLDSQQLAYICAQGGRHPRCP